MPMLKVAAKSVALVTALAMGVSQTALAANITGAGSTFAAPIFAKWAEGYKAQSGASMNYQSIGSGGGIKQINASTVDFGASDKPLKPDVLEAGGLQQFPSVIGGVVPVVNIPGIEGGQVHLTGKVLADIYLGLIKRWNDPVLASWNGGLKLPNMPITVVHRSDGSGTSFLFTTYLAMEDPLWAQGPGGNDAVNWPVGLGGKGNEGVAAFVRQTPGSIGYVEYAYAKQNHMAYAVMQNKAGKWVSPTAANFAAAASYAKWPAAPGFYLLLLDQPGATSWPITGATFVLMHKKQTNPQAGHDVLAFYDWAYKSGDTAAVALDYVTLPVSVKNLVRKSWSTIVGPSGKPVYP
jgi:phosphate transport system substrate-binding protein